MNAQQLEKYSSAITLSDMELFVFPELTYSLLLANLMSPIIWRWRQESTFTKLKGKSAYRTLLRLRQFIMDEYEFNLDLNTWGLTHKDTELNRFKDQMSSEVIARSNALFGYTGDQYYFDVDIRRHFGLDQYDGDVIPYWKTETVEAMNAFRLKEGYRTGAGECVSLSTLYAAAAFIIGGIPLDDIFMILTPLHSQNFIDISDGIITNNRRLVTKAMWFNGTEISNKAQRAIRNEQVTVVAHQTGYIHTVYDEATIAPDRYRYFTEKLSEFLTVKLNHLHLTNFLRSYPQYVKYFQFCRFLRGERMFVKAETLFNYEHGSSFRIYDDSFDKLLDEVAEEDYSIYKLPDRLCVEQLMAFVEYESVDMQNPADQAKVARFISPMVGPSADQCVKDLVSFLHIAPKLPDANKRFISAEPLRLDPQWDREQVIAYLESMRDKNPSADLAFYAFRDMTRCDWRPFLKASLERSPVSIEFFKDDTIEQVAAKLSAWPNESIYEGPRLAHPDEVANYKTGDGIEKALTLANILLSRNPRHSMQLIVDGHAVTLKTPAQTFSFSSSKGLTRSFRLAHAAYDALA
ncbi:MAG: hypothetical protein LLF76_05515 [Planctomycetaceae bacterium]|nr:hypothetical protein [Planctomycetaceae bacterium]